ncbi:uncharacterized protein V6R79_008363 [Siganus canaliculatus]
MDGNHRSFAMKSSFFFLFLVLFQTPAEVQACSVPLTVNFAENNKVGDVVVDLVGGTFTFTEAPDPNPFRIEGNQLLADMILDHETTDRYDLTFNCVPDVGVPVPLDLTVYVDDVNDNAPFFEHAIYNISVSEMAAVGSSVGYISATDRDGDRLFYTLTPESSDFSLTGPNNPTINVAKPLKYGVSSNVNLTLMADDTLNITSTTISITILDFDNRPPWFEPCTPLEIGETVICPSPVYSGSIVVNEVEPGAIALDPPLLAADGDSGINDKIVYSILSGNDDNLFEIDQNTGSIRMLKAADKLETIALTVLAVQETNADNYATATVTITVKPKSLHKPTFQKTQYEGTVSGTGPVMELGSPDTPLQIIATDADYDAIGGRSPYITYSITGTNAFTIIDGIVYMINALPEGPYTLEAVASDSSTGDTTTAEVIVTVTAAPSTSTAPSTATTVPGSTITGTGTTTTGTGTTTTGTGTTITTTTPTPTTGPTGPTDSPDFTTTTTQTPAVDATTTKGTGTTGTTTKPGEVTSTPTGQTTPGVPGTTGTTTKPGDVTSTPGGQTTPEVTGTAGSTMSPSGSTSTSASTATTKPAPGGYGPGDMAALGVVLGVLLLLSVILNVLLMLRHRRWTADWKKLNETSRFTSTLGQSSPGDKDNVRYFNHKFQHHGDGDKTEAGGEPQRTTEAGNDPRYESMPASTAALYAFLGDATSQTSLISSESEKDVKPILTKEKRDDDGYKSVWFKEDIDPDAKNEVVIIPDSRESDSEDEHF